MQNLERVTVYKQLCTVPPVLLFSRSMKIGVNFAFVLTPKTAVKSRRQIRHIGCSGKIVYFSQFTAPPLSSTLL